MNREATLQLLAKHKAILAQRFGVVRLALFGSVVRDAAKSGSGMDVLVALDGPATSERYFGVQFYLEDLLECPIDLVQKDVVRPELKPYIEKDLIHV